MSEKMKISPKNFQCREVLWSAFEDMAKEYGVSVDHLINSAMLEFANFRNYIELSPRKTPKYTIDSTSMLPDDSSLEDAPSQKNSTQTPEIPKVETPKTTPPTPKTTPPIPQQKAAGSKLVVDFDGQVIPVDKEKFMIGRGSSVDLRLPDPSVSRNHAVVIFRDGTYYIKDLGSTNGVEFQGQRYNIRKISHNETYSICSFEFTFRFI
ncbi:FHA domain-containing protein [bacterium]|nr:FHA domain-containing protein [bacterium]